MSYLALARKYRPQTFEDVIGQRHVVKTLSNSITHDRISHAYLFIGPRGIGKTSIARIYAKALNCAEGPTLTPCGKCESCQSIKEGQSLDVIEFDAASNRGVADVQEKIIDNIQYKPANANYKIYIIDEVHMFSRHAFNSLLKTLEEPPSHVIFLFATTEPQEIPDTITSRCQRFVLQRMSLNEIKNKLIKIVNNEGKEIEEKAAEMVAKSSDGIMRDAESLLDQIISLSDEKIKVEDVEILTGAKEEKISKEIIKKLKNEDFKSVIKYIAKVEKDGVDLKNLMNNLAYLFRDTLIYKNTKGTDLLFNEIDQQLMNDIVDEYSEREISMIMDLLFETIDNFNYQTEKRILFEMLLFKIHNIQDLFSIEQFENIASTKKGSNKQAKSKKKPKKQIIYNNDDSINWEKSIIRESKRMSFDTVTPILEEAKFRLNKKGVLYIAWDKKYFFKKGKEKETKIKELVKSLKPNQKIVLYDLSKKKAKKVKKNVEKDRKKKNNKNNRISEEILEFKSKFNGEIISVDIKEE